MKNNQEAVGAAMVGLLLVFGCGGRSDMSEFYADAGGMGSLGGGHSGWGGSTSQTWGLGGTVVAGGMTARGGSVAMGGTWARGGSVAMGGTWARGGSVARGGTPTAGGAQIRGGTAGIAGVFSRGGTSGTTATGPCCIAHASAGCIDEQIEGCVCKNDAACCAVAWDSVCVREVNQRGCGTCAAGGAPNTGGTTSTGGSYLGGATFGAAGTRAATGGAATGGAATGGAMTVAQWTIDDLEDGDGDIFRLEGRGGYWFTFNDGTVNGQQSPVWGGRITAARAILDRAGSNFEAWTLGSGFISWGGGIGLYLRSPSGYFNANKYRGISFWAKVTAGHANVVRMNISDDQTVPDGKYCTECWDHFGVTMVLNNDWQRYGYLWKDLTQRKWGAPLPAAINPTKLRSIEFGTQEGIDFELCIDDIAFIP